MGLTLVNPAAEAAVPLADVRVACGVEFDETYWDAKLSLIRDGALRDVEKILACSLGPQSWRWLLHDFADEIIMPQGPVISVDAVQYCDADGMWQTVDPAIYTLDLISDPQALVLNSGSSWPEASAGGVRIDFTAGYPVVAGRATIPSDIYVAVLALCDHRFTSGLAAEIPDGVMATLRRNRMMVI